MMKNYLFVVCLALITISALGQSDEDEELTEYEADYQASVALYEEAKLLIAEEEYKQAVDFLQQAYEFYDGNSDYTYAAAFAFYKLDSLGAAANKIGWSLGLEPFQSDYLVLAGNIAYKDKAYEDAVDFYSKALQFQDSTDIAIDDLGCYYNLGNCHLQLEKYKLAEANYSYVIDIDPSNYMAYHNRAQAKLRSGNRKDACKDFESAIEAGSRVSKKYLLKYCY